MSEPGLWIVETPHGPNALQKFRKTLTAIWVAHPEVPASIRTEIGIASGEIAANIIEHSGKNRSGQIRMEVLIQTGQVRVRFFDDGLKLDVDLDSVRLPHEMAERGRGLAIARAVLNQLHYASTGQWNCWTLISERFSG
jgi:serine/threonine-protein kinase RsbW